MLKFSSKSSNILLYIILGTMYNYISLGRKIKYFRKRAGLSQLELEAAINASIGSISRIENNLVNPTKETMLEISYALKLHPIETAYLFGIFIYASSVQIEWD